MWRTVAQRLSPVIRKENSLLVAENLMHQQLRTTFILKRLWAPFLHKKAAEPRKLRARHYIYELIKDTNVEKASNIDVILTGFVDGLGNAGDRVSVKPQYAYNNLLLPGLAVYASPENVKKYENVEKVDVEDHYSSPNALKMMNSLKRHTLAVVMNKDSPWTVEPWHIRASFRKSGFVVPEEAITMPEKSIQGPNLDIDGKHFYITVTINNKEKVNVKCVIRHWSTAIVDRLPYEEKFWLRESEPIFPEDVHKDNSTNV